MPAHFGTFIGSTKNPGVIVVPQSLATRQVVELALIWAATDAEEWVNGIVSGDLVPSLRCTREAEEVHRVIACRAAEWTRSGLASAPLPYLAVSFYRSHLPEACPCHVLLCDYKPSLFGTTSSVIRILHPSLVSSFVLYDSV